METFCYEKVRIHSCGITLCGPDWSWDTVRHPLVDYDLWTVLKGNGALTVDGTRFPVLAGSCFLLRPGCRCVGWQDARDRLSVLNVHFDFLGAKGPVYPQGKGLLPLYRRLYDLGFAQRLLYRVLDCMSAGEEQAAAHWLQAALDEIALQDRQSLQPDSLRQGILALCAEIQRDPGEDWRLGRLSARFGYAPDYFGRVFGRMTGSPLSAYVIGVRMNQAKVLLRSCDSPIGEIARQLGYRDVCFFSRQFRQKTGLSPSAYRQAVPLSGAAAPEGSPAADGGPGGDTPPARGKS